jgi:putative membrane protein
MAKSAGSYIFNFVRGGAVGTSEALPGISGGTVALMVGLYDKLIGGAGHVVSGIKRYVTDVPRGRGKDRATEQFRQVDWSVLVPALIGMAVALVLAAVFLAPLVETYAQYAYALFFGLVRPACGSPTRARARSGSPGTTWSPSPSRPWPSHSPVFRAPTCPRTR